MSPAGFPLLSRLNSRFVFSTAFGGGGSKQAEGEKDMSTACEVFSYEFAGGSPVGLTLYVDHSRGVYTAVISCAIVGCLWGGVLGRVCNLEPVEG